MLTDLRRTLRGLTTILPGRSLLLYRNGELGPGPDDDDVVVLNVDEVAGLPLERQPFPYLSREHLSRRMAAGYALYALTRDDELVSFAWARVSPSQVVSEVSCTLHAPTELGWIIDCVTPERHRGRGYYPELLRKIVAKYRHTRCYIYCDVKNLASRRGIEKAGFSHRATLSRSRGRLRLSPCGVGPIDLTVASLAGRYGH